MGFHEFVARNPCSHCQAVYCCWYLALEKVRPSEFKQFDTFRYYLNFPDIEILVNPDGTWGTYLRRPCQHLAREDFRCSIRGTPQHPHICRSFNPFTCFYKDAISGADPSPRYVRLDRTRFERVMREVGFSTFGHVVQLPSIERMQALCATDERETVSSDGGEAPEPNVMPPSSALYAPCADCAALCCRFLYFWRSPISTAADLDMVRYALGFSGVSYAIGAHRHALVVESTCKHSDLQSRKCGVVGSTSRPKRCEFLDEWRCSIREQFYLSPGQLARVTTFDQMTVIEELLGFDGGAALRPFPAIGELKRVLGDTGRLGA